MMSLAKYADRLLAALRIVAGILFLESGVFVLFHWPASTLPQPPASMAGWMLAAGLLELIGGALLVIGLLTRPTAFVLSGMMAVAYWGFHVPMGPWPVTNMGVAAILYCFIFLYLAAAGPGSWAADNRSPRPAPDRRPTDATR